MTTATKPKRRKKAAKKRTPALTADERLRIRCAEIDEKRFAVWQQIRDLHGLGYTVAEIAAAVVQAHDVVDDVLHSNSNGRMRRIVV